MAQGLAKPRKRRAPAQLIKPCCEKQKEFHNPLGGMGPHHRLRRTVLVNHSGPTSVVPALVSHYSPVRLSQAFCFCYSHENLVGLVSHENLRSWVWSCRTKIFLAGGSRITVTKILLGSCQENLGCVLSRKSWVASLQKASARCFRRRAPLLQKASAFLAEG